MKDIYRQLVICALAVGFPAHSVPAGNTRDQGGDDNWRTGDNWYDANASASSGDVYVVDGTLTLTNNSAAGSGVIYIGQTGGSPDDATLAIGADGVNIANDIVVRAEGTGTRTIASTASSGGTEISGDITVSNAVTLSASSGSDLVISGSVIHRGGVMTITNTPDERIDLDGIVSGSGSIVMWGLDVLRLNNANTYSGKTVISNGTVRVTADSGLGTPPALATPGHLTIDGGTFQAAIAATRVLDSNRGIELGPNGGTIYVTGGGARLEYDGILAGSGPLTKTGSQELRLGGVNAYTNSTTISSGTLRIVADRGLGEPPSSAVPGHLRIDGATLTMAPSGVMNLDANRGMDLGAGGATLIVYGNTVEYSGMVTGRGTLTKAGSQQLRLLGENTYTNKTTITGGGIAINADSGLGEAPGTFVADHLTLNGGTVYAYNSWEGSLNSNRGITLGTGGGTIQVFNNKTLAYGGSITGGSGLTKEGAGDLVLSGSSDYAGPTDVASGHLYVNGAYSGNGACTVSSGATLGGEGTYAGAVTVSGGGKLEAVDDGDIEEFEITGPLMFSGAATIAVDVSGSSADQIIVSGTVTALGGEGEIVITPDSMLPSGAEWTVLTGSGGVPASGKFSCSDPAFAVKTDGNAVKLYRGDGVIFLFR